MPNSSRLAKVNDRLAVWSPFPCSTIMPYSIKACKSERPLSGLESVILETPTTPSVDSCKSERPLSGLESLGGLSGLLGFVFFLQK